jgi:hypothetical protein
MSKVPALNSFTVHNSTYITEWNLKKQNHKRMVYGWIIRDQQEKHNTISETDIAGNSAHIAEI